MGGSPEYEKQCQRHGTGKNQLSKLVQQVTKAVLLLGLESQGVAAMVLDAESSSTCSNEPNVEMTGGAIFSHPSVIFILMMLCLFGFLLWRVYRLATAAFESFEQNYTDLAVVESLIDRKVKELEGLQKQVNETDANFRRLREAQNELQGELDMLCDSVEQVHFGLVRLGGYTPYYNLSADDRRRMYDLERANLVSRRVMGADRYMAAVRQQHSGIIHSGEDTDMGDSSEDVEDIVEENQDDEHGANLRQAMHTFRSELNECLQREDFAMAAEFQHCILLMLDTMHGTIPMDPSTRSSLFRRLGDSLESMADQIRIQSAQHAERYNQYSQQLREMAQM